MTAIETLKFLLVLSAVVGFLLRVLIRFAVKAMGDLPLVAGVGCAMQMSVQAIIDAVDRILDAAQRFVVGRMEFERPEWGSLDLNGTYRKASDR